MIESIVCKNISRTFVQGAVPVHALQGIDLTIKRGEFASLCGPSGSGKTTLLNLIGGLDRPTSGEVWVGGTNLKTLNKGELADFRLRSIGFVFQAYNLIPVLSAQENVEFILELQGVSGKERRTRSKEVLSAVGLGELLNRRPHELSGGQQQRVAVARAIVSSPELVLADEPTANLDSSTALSLIDLMHKMNQEKGVTFVFSTHDQLVMKHAHRLITLQDGAIHSDIIQDSQR